MFPDCGVSRDQQAVSPETCRVLQVRVNATHGTKPELNGGCSGAHQIANVVFPQNRPNPQ